MAQGPENSFIAGVHRHLKKKTHAEKMHNAYRRGIPDVYYSGVKGDIWVEYKFIAKIPSKANMLPDLSQPQLEWCEARYKEGRRVYVIVGTSTGGVIFRDLEWMSPMEPSEARRRLLSKKDIALWILDQVGVATCPSSLISRQQIE